MTLLILIAQGLLIGLSLAAPVGPMAILCIHRTLTSGAVYGVLTGFGIAFADAVYGLIAALGFTALSDFLIGHRAVMGIFGGLFLGWLGFWTIINASERVEKPEAPRMKGKFGTFASAFFLTLTNPLTILAYVAIFSSVALVIEANFMAVFLLILAIFSGSLLWWLILTGFVAATKSRMQPKYMRIVNLCSGILLLSFGLFAAMSALF